jgi:hypothetical protein
MLNFKLMHQKSGKLGGHPLPASTPLPYKATGLPAPPEPAEVLKDETVQERLKDLHVELSAHAPECREAFFAEQVGAQVTLGLHSHSLHICANRWSFYKGRYYFKVLTLLERYNI